MGCPYCAMTDKDWRRGRERRVEGKRKAKKRNYTKYYVQKVLDAHFTNVKGRKLRQA